MSEIKKGYCQCGCGGKTTISKWNVKMWGWKAGEPKKFINMHHTKVMRKSEVDYVVNEKTGCWEWKRGKNLQGYGLMSYKGKQMAAYKAYYIKEFGPVKKGLDLDHLCRNVSCVNPKHLEPVTRAVNVQRSSSAKLTREKVNEIRIRWEKGETQKSIAKMFNVNQSHISRLVRGYHWK